MKLPADKLRKVIREEVQRVLQEQEYSGTGFHSGSKKVSWQDLGDGAGMMTIIGKTIKSVDQMGRGHVAVRFQDGTKLEFGADDPAFLTRS